MTTTNPAWDPDVRWRVQHALDVVCRTSHDVLTRHANNASRTYEPPSEVVEGGDVNGLIATAQLQVLDRLDAAIDAARQQIATVLAEIDAYQRARHGDAWQPARASAPGGAPPTGSNGGVR